MNRRDFLKGATTSVAIAVTGVSIPATAAMCEVTGMTEYSFNVVVCPKTFSPLVSVNERDEMGTRKYGYIDNPDAVKLCKDKLNRGEWYTKLKANEMLAFGVRKPNIITTS